MGAQQSVSRSTELWSSVPIRADKILPYIFIGNYSSGCNKTFLATNNITRILNMTGNPHDRIDGIQYLNLAVRDFSTADISVHFQQAHVFLAKARLDGAVALVHCEMGISRAPTIVMAHILLSGNIHDGEPVSPSSVAQHGQDATGSATASALGEQVLLKDVWALVKERRRSASPNGGFFACLQKLEMQLTGADAPSMEVPASVSRAGYFRHSL